MYLKSLVLKGFKSFAERATLDLEPGITVVVGPNGSGKSNIVDAVAWVLGAQAPTAVRSQRMDDVIFAGTASKPALGRAEVALTIDNSSGTLAIGFSEVTITRTLFRSGDSEYAINDVPCRLLDVTELLSDAGVGRNQHVIVGQGQIDAILNARPEERRAIIEEAAGVLKHRKRMERAERRLAATEGNLQRVTDLVREVRRQTRPLERQAEAAHRHAEITVELEQLRRFLAGRELRTLAARLHAAEASQDALRASDAATQNEVESLQAEVAAAETVLSRTGNRRLLEGIAQREQVAERARGQAALLNERLRSLRVIASAADDPTALDALAAELERAVADASAATVEIEELEGERDQLAKDELLLAGDRDAIKPAQISSAVGIGLDPAALAQDAQSALVELRRELAGLRAGLDQANAEFRRLTARGEQLEARAQRVELEASQLEAARAEQDRLPSESAVEVEAAEAAEEASSQRAVVAEAEFREAEADARSLAARADTLAEALAEARQRAGTDALSSVEGILGTLLDVVEVDPGWGATFEAAVRDALTLVVASNRASAVSAVDVLRSTGHAGGVLVPPTGAVSALLRVPASGESDLDALAEPLRNHVRTRESTLVVLLDVLVGSVVRPLPGVEALEIVARHPDVVVVTPEGDCFGPTGWRVAARPKAGSPPETARGTAAAQLEAARRAAAAAERRIVAQAEHQGAADDAAAARGAAEQARGARDRHRAAVAQQQSRAALIDAQRRDLSQEHDQLVEQQRSLEASLRDRRAREQHLSHELPRLEVAAADASLAAAAVAEAHAGLDRQAADLARRHGELTLGMTMLEHRSSSATARIETLQMALETERASSLNRMDARTAAVAEAATVEALLARVETVVAEAGAALVTLRLQAERQQAHRRKLSQELDQLQAQTAARAQRRDELRSQIGAGDVSIAEVRVRLETAREAVRTTLEVEPEELLDAVEPTLPAGVDPADRVREMQRELRLLGPVNPLAMTELQELQTRQDFLETQLNDVKESRRELGRVIRAVEAEIGSVFAGAFADVGRHFTDLFETLFPGGHGELRLTDPDNLMTTGVEIEARPSGKNVRKLSLLSGGERALTALGLLFAIFRSRPSPFYVMDEVEAALDDVNLRRFLDLLSAFRNDAQLIVVSHQKRTMELADCLYGVTMKPGEASRVVSERLRGTG